MTSRRCYLRNIPLDEAAARYTTALNRVGALTAATADIPSESGREDHIPATLSNSDESLSATPVFGKSNSSTLS